MTFKKDKDGDEEMEYQEPQHTVDMIFGGSSSYESRRHLKAMEREVNFSESPIAIKPSKWSETVVSFSKELPPSIKTRLTLQLLMVGSTTIGNLPGRVEGMGQSCLLKEITVFDHLDGLAVIGVSARLTSRSMAFR